MWISLAFPLQTPIQTPPFQLLASNSFSSPVRAVTLGGMKRDNHYEAALEAYLRVCGVPYVAVDEARRSLLGGEASLKSLDFIVSPPGGQTWLVDVKGRRFPGGERQRQYWKNWSTADDLRSLARWERIFGGGAEGIFVFAYAIVGDRSPVAEEQLFHYRDRRYGFLAVRLIDYASLARVVSSRWDTVAMRVNDFRRVACPIDELLGLARCAALV